MRSCTAAFRRTLTRLVVSLEKTRLGWAGKNREHAPSVPKRELEGRWLGDGCHFTRYVALRLP